MAAQPGTAIVLSYGPQGSRQLGTGVVLNYQAAATPRVRITAGVRGNWSPSAASSKAVRAVMPPAKPADPAHRAPWSQGVAIGASHVNRWRPGATADRAARAPWQYRGRASVLANLLAWRPGAPADRERHAPWGVYPRTPSTVVHNPWRTAAPADHGRLAPWGVGRILAGAMLHAPTPAGAPAGIVQWVPWVRFSRPLSPGWGVVTPPGPTPNPDGTFVVPSLPVYIMLNTLSLMRVDTGQALPALAMSLSLDSDSWTWSFSATLPAATLSAIQPTDGVPVVLQAVINGVPYRVMVEGITRDRSFGRDQLRVSGRGLAAELAAPYSPVLTFANTAARTAQQLMGDVLSDNGVPMDWAIDWQLTDWLVPADVWSIQGSRMDALVNIAQAAGGFLLPDPVARTLHVLHRYPVAPWDWGTASPAFELPAAVVQAEGTEWLTRPTYNRVFVSGQRGGILGQATRAGTAGNQVAPMITDALATHADMVRQRALAILADVGRQAIQSLQIPILEETGVIQPGTLIRYVDGATSRRGIVRATQVSASFGKAMQSLSVETHDA